MVPQIQGSLTMNETAENQGSEQGATSQEVENLAAKYPGLHNCIIENLDVDETENHIKILCLKVNTFQKLAYALTGHRHRASILAGTDIDFYEEHGRWTFNTKNGDYFEISDRDVVFFGDLNANYSEHHLPKEEEE